MSNVQALLARCRELGAELTPTPHGTLKVKAPAPLPDTLRDELKQRKAEVLALLKSQRPASAVRPVREPEAITWPRHKLSTAPVRIGDIMRVWCEPVVGRLSREISVRIDLLNDARTSLDVEAFVGADGKMWWRLPIVPGPDTWPCPYCRRPATINDVGPSLDGERTLTMWSCEPCQVVAVTPDAIKEPPSWWVPKTQQ